MANDLVRWGNVPGDDGERDNAHDEEHDEEGVEWDRPPVVPRLQRNPAPIYNGKSERSARRADWDAFDAASRGDYSFSKLREADAAEHRQSRWDWGDLRTWVWIVGMCIGFLLVGALTYYMPQGRHNQNDGPDPTPSIRVY